ncbi:E3 ubiquitin-protein ligase listerin [Ziziphus jujuba]|uniref:E3 ubiquitin-protein ligase listerin n=1 Tax=Ziziphus jujuba TaxID=326968 RepID=A0ABM3IAL9_ZIZJJ|nr:E3 ubiquitin-protein ligase listerin [Ziziphus jujuba]
MGKQKGDGARSKSRASSSSLAASLLPSGSTATVGFGGYVGSSRLDSSTTAEDSTPFSDIDSEVAVHLKRLARKDPITKLKALASLSTLFKEKSGKDLVSIIPQWAFEYKRLLVDYNREVRRATHDTMANLVIVVGRDIAPHLKSLMGPWWFSQFDPVSEVSQAAKRSLQTAFPAQEKRLDALVLCTTEILIYLEENLKLRPEDLSDKAVALDELEEMHQQVISSSLLALATLLDVLVGMQPESPGLDSTTAPPKHASKARAVAISFAEKLFAAHKFFSDFLKYQSTAVRSATYSVLRSFIKNIPNAFDEGNKKTIAGMVLGAFQEKEPACHSSMWDVILLFSKKFPESWTSLNVQKVILNRFWHFLRNGCFGSQQVSYPALVLFLDCVPPKAIVGEKFFLDFFQNFWAGSPSHFSNADRLAFFVAFKECFIWGLQNASRFCDGVDSMHHFRVTVIDSVLVKILWKDYLFSVSLKKPDRVSSGLSVDSSEDSSLSFNGKTAEPSNIRYPLSYSQELGKCIINILSGIFWLEHDLLSSFCTEFQENCLGLFQHAENVERKTEKIKQVNQFILLMGQHAMQKGENWPLVYLVGPMLAKSFPMIRSLNSPDSVRVLSVAVSVFGPRKIVKELFIRSKGCPMVDSSDDGGDKQLEADKFLQIFKETFVPWCLHGNNCSASARLHLLLALLDDEYFSEQWCAVITYAIKPEGSGPLPQSQDSDRITMLAMLLEKARNEITQRKVAKDSRHQTGTNPAHWHHELLDSAAVAIACSPLPFRTSNAQFMHSILGGSTEGDQTSFVSRDAIVLIFQEILKNLFSFIMESSFTWVRNACSLLTAGSINFELEFTRSVNLSEMVEFSLEILDDSFFSLKELGEESDLVSSILAAIFVIDWDYGMGTLYNDALYGEETIETKARLDFGESVHAFHCKISNQFWKSLSLHNRKRLGSILVKCIRSAIFNENKLNVEKSTALCSLWMLEVFSCVCQDQHEEQDLLDQLLCEGDTWPSWVIPDFSSKDQFAFRDVSTAANDSGNCKFVSFIDKLIARIGIDRVLTGYGKHTQSPSKETTYEEVTHAWLAAEMLCTWRWPGGSAVASFLPLLSAFAKSRSYPTQESLVDSTFKILFDGALVHGGCGAQSSVLPSSSDELEDIKEPFLRALVSFLTTMFKDNIWETDKAKTLFELLLNKLYIGETINRNCLSILPPIINVLVRPLCQRSIKSVETGGESGPDSSGENHMEDIVIGWLQRTLLLPPLIMWQTGQDMEDWFQLVISCYPFSAIGGMQAVKLDRVISPLERTRLLELFRKQRLGVGTLTTADLPQVVELLLSKLMVVAIGYCWKEFNEEDWDFVLSQLRRWIQSAVVIMEEIAENVNDAISNSIISPNLDVTFKILEQITFISDPFPFIIAQNSLLAFSLCCGPFGLEQVEDAGNENPLGTERWDPIKDRILEGILRLFFCTGIAEAIASSCCHEAACIISSSRFDHLHFWELVASNVVNSSTNARDRAVKSVEFWGLSKGPISSLYAILFSSKPVSSLQFAAYVVLSTEPVTQLAIVGEEKTYLDGDICREKDSCSLDMSTESSFHLKEEISCMIEKLPYEVLEMDLVAQQRVNVFLAWSLLLSHLWSLPSSSPARERLVQYIQDSSKSVILDCLFQHIPVELCMAHNLKKKDVELPVGLPEAAVAATRAITTGSLLFSVESLWPADPMKMASLAGAIFGLMLRILPAYVREWFSSLRDRSISSGIESFTRAWCSPPLIANELAQIKKNKFVDENFAISVSKSANEVVATYTKDETGMDLVIHLPASYPLRPVDVDCTRSLGISEVKQRKWLMSMMSFVRNQNGALAEAIGIWKRNFDKEFEGVEECPICYSVIHTANHSLPRLACKTCKHKFHSACLYKWFSTSHKSTCPLCQSPF